MQSFWDSLPKPFFCLAPLANVTDAAFRRIIAKYSKPAGPAVLWTEFVSADGLALAPEAGRQKLLRDLLYTETERPIVAQFFTATPAHMEKAAVLAARLGFDGVDINMGCPDRVVEKQGAGAKLILNPQLAQELIAAAKRGAAQSARSDRVSRRSLPGGRHLPVSVKTRLGYHKDTLEEWLPALLVAEPAAIAIHARTRKEMSKVPAHWERIKKAVEIRDEMKSKTLIIGNGDMLSIDDARAKAQETGADGIMLGRAIFGRPWLFDEASAKSSGQRSSGFPRPPSGGLRARPFVQSFLPSLEERLRIVVEHTKLFEELLGDIKNFAIMKKHFKAYVASPSAKELRIALMEANNAREVERVIERFLNGILSKQ
ncbi:tRNA-dihydrouridine synthase [Patescibacteria group bacterium]|nr:tRNA-dihydrouridine synthase [Patescibacteria group bacterium]